MALSTYRQQKRERGRIAAAWRRYDDQEWKHVLNRRARSVHLAPTASYQIAPPRREIFTPAAAPQAVNSRPGVREFLSAMRAFLSALLFGRPKWVMKS